MTAELRKTETFNRDYVAQSVRDAVDKIRGREDKKSNITDNEFKELVAYFAENNAFLNDDERAYIQGYMIEYQEKKTKEFEKYEVTKGIKKFAKDLMKPGNPNTIDSEVEAKNLVTTMNERNSDGSFKLKPADRMYIQTLIVKNGYGHLLFQKESNDVTIVNINVIQPEREETNAKNVEADEPKETESAKTESTVSKPIQKNYTPVKQKRENPFDKKITESENKEKPKIDEKARAQGFGIADKIQEELHDTLTNDSTIRNCLKNVNSNNAYSFVGKLSEITDKKNVFGSFYKRVTAKNVRYVVACLIKQASELEPKLKETKEFKDLAATYAFIKRQYIDKNPDKPINDKNDIATLDKQVKALYDKMSEILK